MSMTLRWGRVSHRRTYGTPECRTMQERMFPIGTKLAQADRFLFRHG